MPLAKSSNDCGNCQRNRSFESCRLMSGIVLFAGSFTWVTNRLVRKLNEFHGDVKPLKYFCNILWLRDCYQLN